MVNYIGFFNEYLRTLDGPEHGVALAEAKNAAKELVHTEIGRIVTDVTDIEVELLHKTMTVTISYMTPDSEIPHRAIFRTMTGWVESKGSEWK